VHRQMRAFLVSHNKDHALFVQERREAALRTIGLHTKRAMC
jgi:hypothetical protein